MAKTQTLSFPIRLPDSMQAAVEVDLLWYLHQDHKGQ